MAGNERGDSKMTTARFGLAAGLGLIVVLAAAPGLGAQQRLSPPDSSELELAGRQIKVTWNQVWRTGANEATSFSTEANLRIGDAEVPAGEYTLYTIPDPDKWTLVVSRQTGQWGTEYHPDMDLARVEMEVEELEEPVESFRIVLYPRGPDEGTLLLEWANTRTSVPFEVLR
jgi:hypothetical protein